MKKHLFFAIILLLSNHMFAYEYANDNDCIYRLNIGDLEAEVVNFCTTKSSVTIPAQIKYRGEWYVVKSIDHVNFEYSLDADYYDDYKKNRANIVELFLPNSIENLEGGAFSDMTRLKTITIPARVKKFNECWFFNNERLDNSSLKI